MLGRAYRILRKLPGPLGPTAERLYASLGERVFDAEVLPGLVVRQSVPKSNAIWTTRLSAVAGHERGVCEWLVENLRPADVFFDVGAHYGFYPVLASTVCPTVEVHAFEPDPHPLAYLRRNRARFDRSRWTICEQSVGREENAYTTTLDEYAARISRPSIVKIDIEGAEVLALGGARRLLEARDVEFLIELHPDQIREHGSSVEELLAQFPDDYRRMVLVDIRSRSRASWTDDMTALFTDDHPYVYVGPPDAERVFNERSADLVHDSTD